MKKALLVIESVHLYTESIIIYYKESYRIDKNNRCLIIIDEDIKLEIESEIKEIKEIIEETVI